MYSVNFKKRMSAAIPSFEIRYSIFCGSAVRFLKLIQLSIPKIRSQWRHRPAESHTSITIQMGADGLMQCLSSQGRHHRPEFQSRVWRHGAALLRSRNQYGRQV